MADRKKNAGKKVDLFLDSGAFSAWTQGVQIDIQQYIDFIKKYQDLIEVYANLDVIGIGGKQPNRITAEKTLENQKIMEQAGLRPLPCFHFGEPFEFLQYYVDNYDYIALGGIARIRTAAVFPWLDKCFGQYICDRDGLPKVKVHGFAATAIPLMIRFPWYSVDSTSWLMTSRNGSILIPRERAGAWRYDKSPWKIDVSCRNPTTQVAGAHITTMPPREKETVLKYIHEKGYVIGRSRFEKVPQNHEVKNNERWFEKKPKDKTALRLLEIIEEDGLCNRYQLRDELNIIYYQDLEKTFPVWPWPYRQQKIRGFVL